MGALRLALRRLAKEPGFAAVAILTLAVGIGANTAIFSIVDGALLRPLAFPQPQQLVSLTQSIPEFAQKYPSFPVNAVSYQTWRANSKLLTDIALLQPDNWVLTGAGRRPQRVNGAIVTASMFPTLEVGPRLGRNFTAQEDQPEHNHVVILSDAYWRSQFHADTSVIGKTIDLDGKPNQIVGVLPASLHFPHSDELGSFFGSAIPGGMDVFQPAGIDFAKAQTIGNFNYYAFARMKPGVTGNRLKAEFDVLEAAFLAAHHAPADIHVHTVVTSLRDQIVGSHALGLWMLLGAVGAILLIVCLNLANLFLVRVHGRGHEIAIRVALGAGRARLVRETVIEGIVLAVIGGGLGVLAAWGGLRWLVAAAPSGIPRLEEVGLNATVLIFSLGLAVACGVLFSLWPALRASRTDPQAALRSGGRGASESGARARTRSWLVGAQSALAALLLIVAGLLVASYAALLHVKKGFEGTHAVEATLDWPGNRQQRAALYESVLEKLSGLPGVQDAGMIDVAPTQGSNDTDLMSYVHDTRPLVHRPLVMFSGVSPEYFTAIGIPLVAGRTFTGSEMVTALAPRPPKTGPAPNIAAVVSATTAAKIWPGKNALGQQFRQSDDDPLAPIFTVVGVAGDVRTMGLDQTPGLQVYLPYTFNVPSEAAMILRTDAPLATLAPVIRSGIWSLQPDAAIPTIETMDEMVASSVASRRFQLMLVLLFAICALFLAALGIYGVVAYSVERRTAEIGLRMTLGAQAGNLIGMVMQQGLTPVVIGLIVGVGAALAGGRLVASLLFGVRASDPEVIVGVSVALLAMGVLACLLPARRATRINPLEALRP